MKLAITQIVLGILIVLAVNASSLLSAPPPYTYDTPGGGTVAISMIVFFPWFFIATVLGIGVSGCGIAQLLKARNHGKGTMKLAITQIALGVLVAASVCFIITWGSPTTFAANLPDGTILHVFFNPGPNRIMAERLGILAFLIGLAVLGCGIAQYIKAKGFKGAMPL